MQQATVNLLADMGVQPAMLQTGLTSATKSTDTTPPSTAITSPSNGANVVRGDPLTISGTATDAGGGVVGGVEVSTDGGTTWHPAQGHESWTYSWIPNVSGAVTVQARAADDSANLGQATSVNTGFGGGGFGGRGGGGGGTANNRRIEFQARFTF